MSRRVTRSMKTVPEEPVPATVPATRKKTTRNLTSDEKKRIKTFLVAHMIHRKRNNSPTDYSDWDTMRATLKQGFEEVLNLYNELKSQNKSAEEIRTHVLQNLPAANKAQAKWHELSLELISSGVDSWNVVRAAAKDGTETINYTHENPVEDLLQEGHIRERVFKKLSINEFKKYFDKDRVAEFTKEQRLDFILQANDPSSKIHLDIVNWIQKGEWTYMKWFFKTVRTEVDGAKVAIDINAHNAGSYLLDLLVTIPNLHRQLEHNKFLEVTDFVKFLVEDMKINVFVKHSHAGAYFNAMTLALYMCAQPSWAGVAWDIVKILLKSYKLTDFYYDGIPEKLTPYGGKHYGVVVTPQKEYVVNNMWICDQLRIDQFAWLLEHGGMDPRETGGLYPDIQDYINKTYNKAKDDYDTIEKSYNVTTNALADIQNRLRSLKDEQTTLAELARAQQTELSTKQTLLGSLSNKKQGIDTTLNRMNVYLGGGKKTKTRKTNNKVQRQNKYVK